MNIPVTNIYSIQIEAALPADRLHPRENRAPWLTASVDIGLFNDPSFDFQSHFTLYVVGVIMIMIC